MNVRHDESKYDAQAETHSINSERRPSVGSFTSTAGASSYGSTGQDREDPSLAQSPHISNGFQQLNMSNKDEPRGPPQSPTNVASGLSRSQSLLETSRSASTRRRDKAAVGFACLNCKKAHLACDVSRPCRRCVQMGRSSTCADVPHKRRGRPRLRDMQQLSGSGASSAVGPTSPTHGNHPGSPLLIRQRPLHSRTGSVNSPYMEASSPQMSSPWLGQSQSQSRRPGPPMGMPSHQRHMSMIPDLTPNISQQSMARMPVSSPEQYRSISATLFVGVDLRIVRALPDVQNFFYASPAVIEGRNLAELVLGDDRSRMPQLIQALQDDIYANRLLFHAHENRQSLSTDLLPYTNADLSHPFPGAKEHLLGLTFVDALNRPIPSRMVAVIGSRSNDRFAYAIVNIQRQDYMHTPPTPVDTMASASPRNYDSNFAISSSPEFTRRHGPSSSVQMSPSFAYRQSQQDSAAVSGALPRSIPDGYKSEAARLRPPTTGLGLNVLPPLQNVSEESGSARAPSPARSRMQRTEAKSRARGPSQSPKRTSMSLSEMLD